MLAPLLGSRARRRQKVVLVGALSNPACKTYSKSHKSDAAKTAEAPRRLMDPRRMAVASKSEQAQAQITQLAKWRSSDK